MKKLDIEQKILQWKKTYYKKGYTTLLLNFFNTFLMKFCAIGYTYRLELNKIEFVFPDNGLQFDTMNNNDLNLIFKEYKEEMNNKDYQELSEKINNSKFGGFVVKKDKEICGYFFVKYRSTYPILKHQYVDNEYNGYLLNEYVFKKYRDQKIQQFGIYNILQLLREKKFKTATTLVSKYNYAARATNEKFGFKKCVICYFFYLGKWMKSDTFFKIMKKY